MNDWFHRGEFTPHPFSDGRRGEAERRRDRRARQRAEREKTRKERNARGSDAFVGDEEPDIRDGLTSPEWLRLYAEALKNDAPYEDRPHLAALREQFIRQLLNHYQRKGVPRE